MGLFSNPAKKAMPYLQQIPGMVSPYFNPYIQAGMGQLPQFQQQLSMLTGDPGKFLNSIGQNYQQSPGFDFVKQQGMDAINRTAARGGMTGSPMNQQQNASMVENLANEDYNNWIKNAMGMYGEGFGGMENMLNQGQQAGSSLANLLGSNQMNMANLQYSGQGNQNNMWGGLLGSGMGILGNILGGMFGGGA